MYDYKAALGTALVTKWFSTVINRIPITFCVQKREEFLWDIHANTCIFKSSKVIHFYAFNHPPKHSHALTLTLGHSLHHSTSLAQPIFHSTNHSTTHPTTYSTTHSTTYPITHPFSQSYSHYITHITTHQETHSDSHISQIQSGAVITRSNMSSYYISIYCNNIIFAPMGELRGCQMWRNGGKIGGVITASHSCNCGDRVLFRMWYL